MLDRMTCQESELFALGARVQEDELFALGGCTRVQEDELFALGARVQEDARCRAHDTGGVHTGNEAVVNIKP